MTAPFPHDEPFEKKSLPGGPCHICEIIDAFETGDCPLDESLPAVLKEWLLQAISGDVELLARIDKSGLRRWRLDRS